MDTIHANDTRGVLDRFRQLVEEVIPIAPRTFLAHIIQICVHLPRTPRIQRAVELRADRVVGVNAGRGWRLEAVGRNCGSNAFRFTRRAVLSKIAPLDGV